MKIYKINFSIVSRIIKLLDNKSIYLGIYKLSDCLIKSKLQKIDLIELSFKNGFSVCQLINYNKFKYLENKKNKKKLLQFRGKNKLKEVKFHLFTYKNDYNNKIKNIKNFLIKNFKVKITLVIKGREILKNSIINKIIENIKNELLNLGFLLNSPNLNQKNIFLYFVSKKNKIKN